jgi:hypothetical protein|tara:strand:+ start:35963 stop:36622 length:660 start_codon:yes stop_codon:yes gene_type:complete
MSEFYDQIDELLGDADSIDDIIITARKCWLYDFKDEPVRLWDGQGTFTDSDGNEWLGTIDQSGVNHHRAPALQDGRDGTSASYNFTLKIPKLPGQDALALYEELKAEQDKVFGRTLTCYLVIFLEGEGLRPNTPLSFYKELTMFSPKFEETIERASDGSVVKSYSATIVAKDNNSGRSEVPGRTYADTMQKRRASELGVSNDRGAEYVALLANRTYQVP